MNRRTRLLLIGAGALVGFALLTLVAVNLLISADWVRERGLGMVVKSFRQIESAAAELLRPGTLRRFRANAAALGNRAVFEIPDFLERILASCER